MTTAETPPLAPTCPTSPAPHPTGGPMPHTDPGRTPPPSPHHVGSCVRHPHRPGPRCATPGRRVTAPRTWQGTGAGCPAPTRPGCHHASHSRRGLCSRYHHLGARTPVRHQPWSSRPVARMSRSPGRCRMRVRIRLHAAALCWLSGVPTGGCCGAGWVAGVRFGVLQRGSGWSRCGCRCAPGRVVAGSSGSTVACCHCNTYGGVRCTDTRDHWVVNVEHTATVHHAHTVNAAHRLVFS